MSQEAAAQGAAPPGKFMLKADIYFGKSSFT